MFVSCDLHIHTDLSPCSEEEMSPGNIVGMALLKGLQVIAITDHQSCGNCAAAISLSEKIGGPLVLPGLEVESQEEIHLVCLFPELNQALQMEKLVRGALPAMENRPEIFGRQYYYNLEDERIGEEKQLLLLACQLDSYTIARLAADLGGVCLPAHIDREANSMLSTLGMIPEDFPVRWLEISACADTGRLIASHAELAHYQLLRSSDAHRLADIAEPGWPLDVPGFTPDAAGRQKVILALRP